MPARDKPLLPNMLGDEAVEFIDFGPGYSRAALVALFFTVSHFKCSHHVYV